MGPGFSLTQFGHLDHFPSFFFVRIQSRLLFSNMEYQERINFLKSNGWRYHTNRWRKLSPLTRTEYRIRETDIRSLPADAFMNLVSNTGERIAAN